MSALPRSISPRSIFETSIAPPPDAGSVAMDAGSGNTITDHAPTRIAPRLASQVVVHQGHGGLGGEVVNANAGSSVGCGQPGFADPSHSVSLQHAIPGFSDAMVRTILAQQATIMDQTMRALAPTISALDSLNASAQTIVAQAHDFAASTRDLVGVARFSAATDPRAGTNLLDMLAKMPAPITNGEQIVQTIIASNPTVFHH